MDGDFDRGKGNCGDRVKGIAVSQGMVISASALGKYKTVFEVASVFFLILHGEYFSIDFVW